MSSEASNIQDASSPRRSSAAEWVLLAAAVVVPRAIFHAPELRAIGGAGGSPAQAATLALAALGVLAGVGLYFAGRAAAGRAAGLLAAALYSTDSALVAREASSSGAAALLVGAAAALAFGGAANGWGRRSRHRGALLLAVGALVALAPLLAPRSWPGSAARVAGSGGAARADESVGVGEAIYQGSNPESRGIGAAPPALFASLRSPLAADRASTRELYRALASADAGRELNDGEADRLWGARSRAFARRQFAEWIRLEFRKTSILLAGADAASPEHAASAPRRARSPLALPVNLLVPLGAFGALLAAARPGRSPLALGMLLAALAATLAVSVVGRSVLPVAAALALLGAEGVVWAARGARLWRPAALALPAIAIPIALAARVDDGMIRGHRAQAGAARCADSLLAEARVAYSEDRFAEYRKNAIRAAHFAPELLEALPMLGEEAVNGSIPRAEPAILAALRPGRAEEAILTSRFYVAAGEDNGAYERLRGQERHPWFGSVVSLLRARSAIRLGHAPEALALLETQKSLTAEGAALRVGILTRLGDPRATGARADLDAHFGPTSSAHFCGRALRELGDPAAARDEFDDAIRRFPRFARARLERAACRLALGDDRGAIADADSALAIDPTAHLASLSISDALGRLAAAEPADAALRERLGAALIREGDLKSGARVLGSLVAEEDASASARTTLMKALVAMGRAPLTREAGAAPDAQPAPPVADRR